MKRSFLGFLFVAVFSAVFLCTPAHAVPTLQRDIDKRNPDSHSAMSMSPVPEPATMLLFGCGLIGLAAVGRKKFLDKG